MAQHQDIDTASPADIAGGARTPVTLLMPARAEYVALSRLAIAALANLVGLDQETLADLKLAVTEACSLFVRDVSSETEPADIRVEFDLAEETWSISVSGSTGTDGLSGPDGPEGLALVVIEALTDEVETRQDGAQGWLRFTKSIR